MNLTASIKLCASGGPLVAPDRFRIWKAGDNPGDYGKLRFTPAAASAVMAAYESRGVALLIDLEHNTNPRVNPTPDPNNPPPTGGYLALELVDTPDGPELWGVPRWSFCGREHAEPGVVCCARHQIETGQRVYVSPDWDMDPETREPIRLNRMALVAEPGTHGIPMLASASLNRRAGKMDEKQIRAAYALAKMQAESAEGPLKDAANAYVEQLKGAAANMGVDLDAAAEEPAPASEPAPAAAAGGDAPAPNPVAASDANPAEKPMNAAASRKAMATDKPVTMADVQRFMAEKAERDAMLADPRLSPAMRNVVASADLKTARSIIKALPAVEAPKGTSGDAGGPVNHTASAHAAEPQALNAVETYEVERFRGALGQTAENVTAARKMMTGDPEGGVTVSLKALVDKHIALRKPTAPAMRFGG